MIILKLIQRMSCHLIKNSSRSQSNLMLDNLVRNRNLRIKTSSFIIIEVSPTILHHLLWTDLCEASLSLHTQMASKDKLGRRWRNTHHSKVIDATKSITTSGLAMKWKFWVITVYLVTLGIVAHFLPTLIALLTLIKNISYWDVCVLSQDSERPIFMIVPFAIYIILTILFYF